MYIPKHVKQKKAEKYLFCWLNLPDPYVKSTQRICSSAIAMFISLGCLDRELLPKGTENKWELQIHEATRQCRLFDVVQKRPFCEHLYDFKKIACHLMKTPGMICPECEEDAEKATNDQKGLSFVQQNLLTLARSKGNHFRTIISTTENQQVTVQTLQTGGMVEKEIHLWSEQLITVLEGRLKILLEYPKTIHHHHTQKELACSAGETFLIPRHTFHQLMNDSARPVVFASVYTPPMHPPSSTENDIRDVLQAVAPFSAKVVKDTNPGVELACGYGPPQLSQTFSYRIIPNHCDWSLMIFAPMNCIVQKPNEESPNRIDFYLPKKEKTDFDIQIACSTRSQILWEYFDWKEERAQVKANEKVATIRFTSDGEREEFQMMVTFTIEEEQKKVHFSVAPNLVNLIAGETKLFQRLGKGMEEDIHEVFYKATSK